MGQPFPQDATPGGVLIYPQIQSPNYVEGVSGWSVNQDGTAQFNQLTLIVQTSNAAILIYVGGAASGTLVGSWSSQAGTDQYENPYPAGLYASSGFLSGLTFQNASVIASTLIDAVIQGASVTAAAITGGTITESTITFDGTGGKLLVYTSTSTTVTLTSGSSWTAPAGNYTQGKVECWGADASGGGGSNTEGGEGGGGAAYSCEPNYPLVPGQQYNISIGMAGAGGWTYSAGSNGGPTAFDGQGVVANGGQAGLNFIGGEGGQASGNTISWAGGNGGSPSGSASAGGGGRAGSTGPGGNGANGSGSTPGAGGAAGTGTGGLAGGAGVAASTNGNNGGGGSGAGEGSSGTTYQSKVYHPTSTSSWYGSQVGGGNRNTNGSMFQGCADGELYSTGDQESFANYNHSQMQSDWSGWTIDSVQFAINNQHSWYSGGCYCILGWFDTSSNNHYNQQSFWVDEGSSSGQQTISGISGLKSAVANGTFWGIILGPSSSTSGGSTDLYNYGYFQGGTGTGAPIITVNGHQGSGGSYLAGSGSGGVIKVTYVSTATLECAISPAAGTDASGNAFGAGYTGPVQAFVPGSSPSVAEVWHSLPLTNSWTVRTGGYYAQYRMTADNMIEIVGEVGHASTSGTSQLATALPSAYWPSDNQDMAAYATTSGGTVSIVGLYLSTSGVLTFYNLPTNTTVVAFNGRTPKNGAGSP